MPVTSSLADFPSSNGYGASLPPPPSAVERFAHFLSHSLRRAPPSADVQMALERFLAAALVCLKVDAGRRQDVLRIVFRYLQCVLPHPWLPPALVLRLLAVIRRVFVEGGCLAARRGAGGSGGIGGSAADAGEQHSTNRRERRSSAVRSGKGNLLLGIRYI